MQIQLKFKLRNERTHVFIDKILVPHGERLHRLCAYPYKVSKRNRGKYDRLIKEMGAMSVFYADQEKTPRWYAHTKFKAK